jgi:hypothetical protein
MKSARLKLRYLVLRLAFAGRVRWVHALPLLDLIGGAP